jgi:hypothetical protein
MKRAYRALVTTGMFVVRTAILGLMALFQLVLGGASIRSTRHSRAESDERHAAPKSGSATFVN